MVEVRHITRAILASLILLLPALSCSKDGGDVSGRDDGFEAWAVLTGDCPITFATSISGPAAKSPSPLPSGTSFGVFAFYQPGTVGGVAGAWGDGSLWSPNFMYNQRVQFDGSDCAYAPLKYWPNNEENTITFWAYYPYEDAETVDPCIDRFRIVNSATTYSPTAHGIPNIEYTTDGHTDFLVSDVKRDQHHRDEGDPNLPNNPDATVYFTFGHAMCWIDFIVRKVDPDDLYHIKLNVLQIKDIYFTGVLNQQLGWIATLGDKDDLTIFDDEGDPANRVELNDHADPLHEPPVELLSLPASGDPLIMPLPQYLKWTSASIHVEYSLSRGDGPATVYVFDVPVGDLHEEWEMNKHYTYRININPGNPILFTATVAMWDAEEEVYYYFE